MSRGQPHPTAGEERDDEAAVPAGADPRRLHTDPEFDEDDERSPPNADEQGDIP